MKIFNAKGQVAGRLAAQVAKSLLNGEEVAVVEVQDAVLSGPLANHVDRLKRKRGMKAKADPSHSPKFPRVPHMMFKQMVRGMLPKKSGRGRDALHRLKCYSGIPADMDVSKAEAPTAVKAGFLKSSTIGKLCDAFGYKAPE